MKRDLQQRTLLSVLLGLLLISSWLISPLYFFWFLFSLLMIGTGVGIWEYLKMTVPQGPFWLRLWGPLSGFCFVFASYLTTLGRESFSWAPHFSFFVSVLCVFAFSAHSLHRATRYLSTFVFAMVYIGIPMGIMTRLLWKEEGLFAFVYLLCVTKLADLGAFFVGRRWGKRKLAEKISPKKTREGFWAALVLGTLVSLLMSPFSSVLSLSHAFILGLSLSFLGQYGDLAESLMKRDAGVKDSNRLPGFGGILDIIDSIVFTSPIVYWYFL